MEQPEKLGRGDLDMISSLPDHLLHLIMSFLNARAAVKLCILSKRWENLWTTLPFLNFDIYEFYCDMVSDDGKLKGAVSVGNEQTKYINGRFIGFVDNILLRREVSALHMFRFYCPPLSSFYYVVFIKSWVHYALKHNPRVLDLTFAGMGSLPCGVFSCSSLVDLSLSLNGFTNDVQFINLPCLRRLHLQDISINQEFVEKLFSGCPMLEFFHLHRCCMEFSNIHSQSLKCLKLEGNIRLTVKRLQSINAPKLLSFYYRCLNYHECKPLLNMPSLSSASICVDYCLDNLFYDGNSYILSSISSVKHLKLNGFGILVCT
jgi:F-box domain